jgi:hypothetical protein
MTDYHNTPTPAHTQIQSTSQCNLLVVVPLVLLVPLCLTPNSNQHQADTEPQEAVFLRVRPPERASEFPAARIGRA